MNYSIHNFLNVRSNIHGLDDIFPPFFITNSPSHSDLTILFSPFKKPNASSNIFFLEGTWFMFFTAKILIRDLHKKTTIVIQSPQYRLLKKISLGLRQLLESLLRVKLLQKRCTLIHSACMEYNKKGLLIVAPPDTGKTATALLLAKKEFNYLSDDITLINHTCGYCYPKPMTIHPHHISIGEINLKRWEKIKILAKKTSLISVPPFRKDLRVNPNRILSPNKFCKSSEIKHIFFLEEGPYLIKEVDEKDAFRRILTAGRIENHFYENDFLLSYLAKCQSLNLESLLSLHWRICERLTKHSQNILIRTQNKNDYSREIEKCLRV